ncbi:SRPBCC family protein [Pyxidicoccus trucidator]|uniref:SRPBCC family protein n=1 Tax=Pyxidicoccus trucidator TaxID=2709662 RepID=UPI0013DB1EEE|nr:SRPBCC family protein [Pyxidicoccus trucidator]
MTQQPVIHSTFTIDRVYKNASPQRVFAAFSTPATKRRWMVEGEGWEVLSFDMDFRVGGLEQSRFRFKGGPEIRNDTVYQDIVPNQRIVIAYTMGMGDNRFSASLATMEFVPAEGGTRLVFTEQGAYFDNADAPKNREEGTRQLLEALAEELKKSQ